MMQNVFLGLPNNYLQLVQTVFFLKKIKVYTKKNTHLMKVTAISNRMWFNPQFYFISSLWSELRNANMDGVSGIWTYDKHTCLS